MGFSVGGSSLVAAQKGLGIWAMMDTKMGILEFMLV